ncbi:MAG: DNA internalization-related competence protein ComEC/Rec2, partial [Candidatus Cloacimonadaceae bacterium]|nr:DNA internalization-related competence protein ComEC/Rec2 [Candidatus Cloacimonadaceae bacterium]
HWSAPVTRAVLMIFLFILARWLGRRVSRVQVLALSFFIITVISPRELFSIGLQLSFVAVAIIFFAVPHLYPAREEEGKRSLMLSFALRQVNYLLLSLFVGIGLFPLLSYHFGKASLNGILGNLIGVPLMAMLVPLSFLLIFVPAGNLLFTALANTYNLLHGIFDAWVSFIARLPLYAENLYFLPWQLLLLSTAILCFYLLVNKRFSWIKYTLGSSALLAGIILISGFLSKELKVYVFDAGVADCTLVQTPSGEMIMIDTGQGYPRLAPSGDRQYDSWMQRRLLSWLKRRRIESIDHLVLTHMHQDHYGGLPALATELKINRIYVSDETQAHPLWKTWQAEGMFSATLIHTISDTITYQLRDVRLKFLHPDSLHYSTSENDRSLVFRMDYGHTSYLFTGDIEADAEQYILSRYAGELKADYLKVPHHGSKTSSTPAFIRTVLPREAWITSSARNKHGFPHKESIETLTRYDAQVHITHSGSILHTRSATQKRIDKRAVHGKFWRTKE